MIIHDYVTALRQAGYREAIVRRMPHGYALRQNPMLPGDTYCYVAARAA